MCTANANGITLYYERHGSGAPLLWIGGLGANLAEIPYLIDAYSRHHDFIAYDQRGCGRSDKPEGAYSMAQWADDAAALLDALGLDSAAVYGSSMGGMVAQELALRHPHRVSSLILGCTTGGALRGARPSNETVIRMAQNAQLTGDAALAAGWPLGYSQAYIDANYAALLARSKNANHWSAPHDSWMRQVVAAAQHDTWDRLCDIACPVMIIHGEDDVMMPVENARMMHERMPQAELRVLTAMGHGYNLEAQAEADALVLEFCARHPTARTDVVDAVR